jgi:hypothetical protein
MITLNNTKLDTVSNATLNNCLVLSSVSDSTCTDTVSLVFNNCVESFTELLNQAWLTVDSEINSIGQTALSGLASDGGDLISWAYYVDQPQPQLISFSIDIDQIEIEMLTPIYTIEHLH